ncbi:hypothetical protein DICA2_F34244 [Diutina catenulata]
MDKFPPELIHEVFNHVGIPSTYRFHSAIQRDSSYDCLRRVIAERLNHGPPVKVQTHPVTSSNEESIDLSVVRNIDGGVPLLFELREFDQLEISQALKADVWPRLQCIWYDNAVGIEAIAFEKVRAMDRNFSKHNVPNTLTSLSVEFCDLKEPLDLSDFTLLTNLELKSCTNMSQMASKPILWEMVDLSIYEGNKFVARERYKARAEAIEVTLPRAVSRLKLSCSKIRFLNSIFPSVSEVSVDNCWLFDAEGLLEQSRESLTQLELVSVQSFHEYDPLVKRLASMCLPNLQRYSAIAGQPVIQKLPDIESLSIYYPKPEDMTRFSTQLLNKLGVAEFWHLNSECIPCLNSALVQMKNLKKLVATLDTTLFNTSHSHWLSVPTHVQDLTLQNIDVESLRDLPPDLEKLHYLHDREGDFCLTHSNIVQCSLEFTFQNLKKVAVNCDRLTILELESSVEAVDIVLDINCPNLKQLRLSNWPNFVTGAPMSVTDLDIDIQDQRFLQLGDFKGYRYRAAYTCSLEEAQEKPYILKDWTCDTINFELNLYHQCSWESVNLGSNLRHFTVVTSCDLELGNFLMPATTEVVRLQQTNPGCSRAVFAHTLLTKCAQLQEVSLQGIDYPFAEPLHLPASLKHFRLHDNVSAEVALRFDGTPQLEVVEITECYVNRKDNSNSAKAAFSWWDWRSIGLPSKLRYMAVDFPPGLSKAQLLEFRDAFDENPDLTPYLAGMRQTKPPHLYTACIANNRIDLSL